MRSDRPEPRISGHYTDRHESEITEFAWARADRLGVTRYLEPGETKNDETERIYMDGTMEGDSGIEPETFGSGDQRSIH